MDVLVCFSLGVNSLYGSGSEQVIFQKAAVLAIPGGIYRHPSLFKKWICGDINVTNSWYIQSSLEDPWSACSSVSSISLRIMVNLCFKLVQTCFFQSFCWTAFLKSLSGRRISLTHLPRWSSAPHQSKHHKFPLYPHSHTQHTHGSDSFLIKNIVGWMGYPWVWKPKYLCKCIGHACHCQSGSQGILLGVSQHMYATLFWDHILHIQSEVVQWESASAMDTMFDLYRLCVVCFSLKLHQQKFVAVVGSNACFDTITMFIWLIL